MRDLRAVIHGITTAVLCGMAVSPAAPSVKLPEKLIRQQWRQPMEILSVAFMRTILSVPR